MPDWITLNGIEVPEATPTGEAGVKLKDNFLQLANRALTVVQCGRLSLDSSDPAAAADQLAKATVYFSPFQGNEIALYDEANGIWKIHAFTQLSSKLTDIQSGTTTSSSAVVTGLTDTSGLLMDMEITGTGIAADTRIASIDSDTQITLSANATASGTNSLTFKVPPFMLVDFYLGINGTGNVQLMMVPWATSQTKQAITAATNATPVVVTSIGHGLSNGDVVGITGLAGNTSPNNMSWTVFDVTTDTFKLQGSVGNGTYTSGGTWYLNPSARAVALDMRDGVYVQQSSDGLRYLGTCRTTSVSGESEDSAERRLLWNYANRVNRRIYRRCPVWIAHTYTTTVIWRPWDNDATQRCEVIQGVADDCIGLAITGTQMLNAATGVGIDTTTLNVASVQNQANTRISASAYCSVSLGAAGYHYLQAMERSTSSTATYYYYDIYGIIRG